MSFTGKDGVRGELEGWETQKRLWQVMLQRSFKWHSKDFVLDSVGYSVSHVYNDIQNNSGVVCGV